MSPVKKFVIRLWDKVLVAFGVICVLVPVSPLNMPFTYRDSGVFLYIGWRILNGEVPYLDIWDHKPPLIFYINALGLAITNNSRWGVWLIEFISLFLAAWIGFRLIKRAMGIYPAVFSLAIWLLTLVFIIQGGNLTTEYTLLLQFICLYLIYDLNKAEFPKWKFLAIGITGALAFLTKQSSIGLWIAVVLFLTISRITSQQINRWAREFGLFAIGITAVFIPVIIYFGLEGSLPHFWNASFEYNFVYAGSISDPLERLKPILVGMSSLTQTGLFQVALIGYVIALLLIRFRRSLIVDWLPLLVVGLINLPIELILISASGRMFAHYYITLLPVLSLFAAVTFWTLLAQLASWGISDATKFIFTISVTGIILWSSLFIYAKQVNTNRNVTGDEVVNYIQSVTAPDDFVLLWGAEAASNFFSERRSPSPFIYLDPLYIPEFANEQMLTGFLQDVIKNKPQLIIDPRNRDTPVFEFPIDSESVQADLAYLKSQYRNVGTVASWSVYKLVDSGP